MKTQVLSNLVKKLVKPAAVFALTLIATTGWSEGLSSGIVGYATTATRLNGNAMGLSFVQIGGDNDMDLTKLTVVGYEGSSSGEVQIQTLDELGRTLKQYDWHDFTKQKDNSYHYGWYNLTDGKYVEEGEVLFPAGKGLWVMVTREGLSVMCNGQVITAAQTIPLPNNGSMVANPYPVDVQLVNMWVTGYDDVGSSSGEVQLQTLDDIGRTIKQYDWHDFTKAKDNSYHYGWYNLTDGKYVTAEDNVVLKSGAAYWAFCSIQGQHKLYLNFPAILTDAE